MILYRIYFLLHRYYCPLSLAYMITLYNLAYMYKYIYTCICQIMGLLFQTCLELHCVFGFGTWSLDFRFGRGCEGMEHVAFGYRPSDEAHGTSKKAPYRPNLLHHLVLVRV